MSGDPLRAWDIAGIPSFSFSGIEYGIALLLGVLSAEAFNQVWWQRVYSGKDIQTTRRGFFIAGLMVFPIVMVAGLIGLYGAGAGNYSVSFFEFLRTLPSWLNISGMVLAVTLMMSSLDSFLNGMASLAMIDMKRMMPNISSKTLVLFAQIGTVVFGVIAALLASQGTSVLYIFLVADLICAGVAFPVFYGLFSQQISARTAVIASIAGILVGLAFFPDPSFSRGNLAGSFIAALLVPAALTLSLPLIQRRKL
jgi:Na+/proline symporter